MRKNVFAVWAITAVVIFEQSAFARIAFRPAHSDKPTNNLPFAGIPFAISNNKAQMVRVTDDRDAARASAPSSPGFNLDSTRFFIMLDGVATLYSVDAASLRTEKQGPLFDQMTLQADGAQWSAVDPGTLIALDAGDGAISINAYDIQSHSLTPVKDFSTLLPKGEASGLSKSWSDDNHFAFTYREAGQTSWRYVIVWDRLTDNLYQFDVQDQTSGVAGFADARLDRSGESLIVNGDVTRAWRYLSQQQHESTLLEQTSSSENESLEIMNMINDSHARLPRNNVSRDGQFSMFNAAASDGRSDVFIATINDNVSAMAALMWTNILNCTASSNSLQKTGGSDQSDDARATSVQSIESGDASVEFTAKETNKDRWCGLNNSNAIHQEADDINFAIKLNSKKKAIVTENGSVKAKIKYKANNVFRIAIESGVVNYYKNGSVFYTSSARPVYPLLVNASLMHSMSSISNVMINGAGFGPVASISPAKAITNAGGTIQFTAVITAVGTEPVIWSATGGTISSTGLYTAPNTAGSYVVNAASASSPSVKASAFVTVTGTPDTTPPVISSVTATNVTASGATINWTTNEPSDTQVEYGTTSSYGSLSTQNPTLVTSHSVAFAGLASGTLYHYRARSKDAAGNVARSSDFTFTTSGSAGDTTPPVLSAIASSNVTASGATISWTTNEASDTQVEYGTTSNYTNSTTVNSAMTTSHSAQVSGLNAGTLYHYRVK
ncbi:MAG: fibronectin type III domain-containing protein, partial [Blastocatellia bacterium]